MRIALVYGGRSVEHEVSVRSALNVYNNIDKKRYDVLLIGICKKGDWYLTETVTTQFDQGQPIDLRLMHGSSGFLLKGETLTVDLIFPVVHGSDGEDGGIQGFFSVLGVPVVGSDVLGSAIAMDKVISKRLWSQAGLPVADFLALDRETLLGQTYDAMVRQLGSPFMLKAGNLGSSVGISKVSNAEEFEIARTESLRFSNIVLAERFVAGRELECAVLGNESIESTLPGEIILKKNYSFYTYEAKYEDEDAIEIRIPADVDSAVAKEIQAYCIKAFEIAQCKDYGRVDLFLTDDNKVIINEINTIPGFTNVSMFPMLWKNMGIEYPDLIQKLIDLCLERHQKGNQLSRSFR